MSTCSTCPMPRASTRPDFATRVSVLRAAGPARGSVASRPLRRGRDDRGEAADRRRARSALPRTEGRAAGRDSPADDRRSRFRRSGSSSAPRSASATGWPVRAATPTSLAEERAWAPKLYAALRDGGRIRRGEFERRRRGHRSDAAPPLPGPGRLEYAAGVDSGLLRGPRPGRTGPGFAVAYRLGRARLIDNIVARPHGGADELARVVLAAGQGTRMKSDLAKVLHPLSRRAPADARPSHRCRACRSRRRP